MLEAVLRFFSLETLDTRLSPPADVERRRSIVARALPVPRWRSLEFRVYAVVFVLAVPLMWKTAMEASNEHNPNYPKYMSLLSDGWMFGRKVDNSDTQYRFLRDNFWLIVGLIGLHTAIRRAFSAAGVERLTFDLVFGLIFVFALHGANVLKIGVHVVVMYFLGRLESRRAIPALWVYGVGTLFMNEHLKLILVPFTGIVSRWDVFYNFTLLRLLSFNLDFIRAQDSDSDYVQPDLNDRGRMEAPIPKREYTFSNYLSYVTYAPLFIAGPIITFNDYIYQTKYHQTASTRDYRRTAVYGFRLLFCILVMEFILHFMYVVAVSKTKAWDGDTPFQLSMIGMFNLNVIWLKLLIPWRLFRFWSLVDGIDPPENMIRCMDNNYSALAFWRAWHRSFNRWLIRYVYAPLGAGKTVASRVCNSLLVFSFVAVWHDIELRLLMWGWLVVVFLMPEILATLAFKRFSKKPWFRHLCAVGAVANIWMMMLANLFGFCLGKDGTMALLHEMFSTAAGLRFFATSLAVLFVGTQVMFEMREAEKRRGIDIKC